MVIQRRGKLDGQAGWEDISGVNFFAFANVSFAALFSILVGQIKRTMAFLQGDRHRCRRPIRLAAYKYETELTQEKGRYFRHRFWRPGEP